MHQPSTRTAADEINAKLARLLAQLVGLRLD
jgi:hypothetical protein